MNVVFVCKKDSHRIYHRPDVNDEHWRVSEDQSTDTMDYANSCGVKYIKNAYIKNRNDENVVN